MQNATLCHKWGHVECGTLEQNPLVSSATKQRLWKKWLALVESASQEHCPSLSSLKWISQRTEESHSHPLSSLGMDLSNLAGQREASYEMKGNLEDAGEHKECAHSGVSSSGVTARGKTHKQPQVSSSSLPRPWREQGATQSWQVPGLWSCGIWWAHLNTAILICFAKSLFKNHDISIWQNSHEYAWGHSECRCSGL